MNRNILDQLVEELHWQLPGNLTLQEGGEGIELVCDGKTVTLTYKTPVDLARGLVLLKQFGSSRCYTHRETCAFETFGIMIDCSRNAVMTFDNTKRLFRLLALMGYNMVQLYTEDTYEIEGEPYFGYLRGRYTAAELKELDAYAAELGIELMPCMQTLAHLNAIFHWNVYESVHDCHDILLCDEEKTYELIDRMFASLSSCLRSRRIHIGMDEAHMVGLGKYLDRNGFQDRFAILSKHLAHVCEIAKKYGYHPVMWSDMFFRLANQGDYYLDKGRKTIEIPPLVYETLPQDIGLVYWDYYHDDQSSYDAMITEHRKFERELWFASNAGNTVGLAPFNAKNIQKTEPALLSCLKNGVSHVMTTIWGDNGNECSLYALLPAMLATAHIAYGQWQESHTDDFFHALTDMQEKDFMLLDRLNQLTDTLNPATNLLYNDPLLGILDQLTACRQEDIASGLAAVLPVARRCAKDAHYGYIFRMYHSLIRFLQVKACFGIRLRRAYQDDDREGLSACLLDCDRMLKRLDRLWEDFRYQWVTENKPHGFDVQDIRLGGLRQRIVACRLALRNYLSGACSSIPELEEEILPYKGYNPRVWSSVATVNVL